MLATLDPTENRPDDPGSHSGSTLRDDAGLDRLRAGRLSLVAGMAILGGKLGLAAYSGSSAVFSDALESSVNVAAAGLLLWSLRIAARPADPDHPYGHGKIEFFTAGVEGTLIAVAAVWIAWEAFADLARGAELARLDQTMLGLLALSAVNGWLGRHLVRTGKRTDSLALVADGRHLLTDVVTSLAVVAGLFAVWLTGIAWLDPLVALGIGVHVLASGTGLIREAIRGLMDEADPALLVRISEGLESAREPSWIDAHDLRAWRSGASVHADLRLTVPRYFDVGRTHAIDRAVAESLRCALDAPADVIVHFDPCVPAHCSGCAVADCAIREGAFSHRASFTLASTTRREAPHAGRDAA